VRTFWWILGIGLAVLWIIHNPAAADHDVHNLGQFLTGIVS
jgi:hypothetical protein